jgi:hypothetical protein
MCEIQVPVIAVITKYDQFKREIRMKAEDQHRNAADLNTDAEAERSFYEHYLANLGGSPLVVRLESEDFVDQLTCTTLIDVLQKCTSLANIVLILFTRLPMLSLAVLLTLCSWQCKRIIWS